MSKARCLDGLSIPRVATFRTQPSCDHDYVLASSTDRPSALIGKCSYCGHLVLVRYVVDGEVRT